jgi:hypothetical protein
MAYLMRELVDPLLIRLGSGSLPERLASQEKTDRSGEFSTGSLDPLADQGSSRSTNTGEAGL